MKDCVGDLGVDQSRRRLRLLAAALNFSNLFVLRLWRILARTVGTGASTRWTVTSYFDGLSCKISPLNRHDQIQWCQKCQNMNRWVGKEEEANHIYLCVCFEEWLTFDEWWQKNCRRNRLLCYKSNRLGFQTSKAWEVDQGQGELKSWVNEVNKNHSTFFFWERERLSSERIDWLFFFDEYLPHIHIFELHHFQVQHLDNRL